MSFHAGSGGSMDLARNGNSGYLFKGRASYLTHTGCIESLCSYRQVSNIRSTKPQHLKDPRTVLRLSLPNPESLIRDFMVNAVRQQAITWSSFDADLFRHMESLGANELMVDIYDRIMQLE